MATNLMNVFKNVDLQGVGKTAANIVSLAFKPNKKTGAKIARAVLDDGTTLIKTVTASGVVSETIHRLPEITSTVQRNEVIKTLFDPSFSKPFAQAGKLHNVFDLPGAQPVVLDR